MPSTRISAARSSERRQACLRGEPEAKPGGASDQAAGNPRGPTAPALDPGVQAGERRAAFIALVGPNPFRSDRRRLLDPGSCPAAAPVDPSLQVDA